MKVFIYLNGNRRSSDFYLEEYKREYRKGDKVICANGGFDFAASIGIKPDVVVGDLDSKKVAISKGIKLIKYPAEKNFSDFELALEYSRRLNPDKIVVYGALGGRKDHEIINLIILAYANIPMVFVEKEIEVYNVRNSLTILDSKGKTCSLVSLSENTIIRNLEGFKYRMANELLNPSSRGLSNIITESTAKIDLEGRAVLFFLNKQIDKL